MRIVFYRAFFFKKLEDHTSSAGFCRSESDFAGILPQKAGWLEGMVSQLGSSPDKQSRHSAECSSRYFSVEACIEMYRMVKQTLQDTAFLLMQALHGLVFTTIA